MDTPSEHPKLKISSAAQHPKPTTPNYLPNIIRKDNTNISQTLSMPTSPQNNKELLDTLSLPQ
jgi:hypothetical protein